MFKGPGGMGDMMGLMKQAQKMKKDMKKFAENLEFEKSIALREKIGIIQKMANLG